MKATMRRSFRAVPTRPRSFRVADEMWELAIARADREGVLVTVMLKHFLQRWAEGEQFPITRREYPAGPTQSVRVTDRLWAQVLDRLRRDNPDHLTYSDVLYWFTEAWVDGRSEMPTVVVIEHEVAPRCILPS
jgi:hypothetical protein